MIAWAQIVVSNLAVAAVVGALAWRVGRGGRRGRLAHALWVVFFIKLITPPLLWLPIAVPADWLPPAVRGTVQPTAAVRSSPPSASVSVDPSPRSAPARSAAAVGEAAPADRFAHFRLGTCVACVWLGGFLVLFLRGLIRFARFRRLLLREAERDERATEFVRRLLRSGSSVAPPRGGRSRGPEVLRIPVRVSPMLFGLGRRTAIVCPDQLWRALSDADREAFLAHEAAHYFRRDHWVRWLEWFVTALYWWFPGVYVARRELERHEEAACDAWAVRMLQSTPRRYAEALLRVVDFLSEHRVGIPRLASGMRPTDSLEQRLRLLMRPAGWGEASRPVRWTAAAACFSLWLVHPSLQPRSRVAAAAVETRDAVEAPADIAAAPDAPRNPLPDSEPKLPNPPQGFWNHTPRRQWADFSLGLPGARVIAEASRGIIIERPDDAPLAFSVDELSALAEIPSTQRVVIGDASGRVRLWDLRAGLPTSLIGRHGAPVTSIAFHESFGLVTSDRGGSVMRWDLQSGQVLASWSEAGGPIQSVRRSGGGRALAVLVGSWNQSDPLQHVHLVEPSSLEIDQSLPVPAGTAVVLEMEAAGWVTVDWSGVVRRLATGEPVTTVAKHDVSALVFTQETMPPSPPNGRRASFPLEEL